MISLVHHIPKMQILNAQSRETIFRPVQQLIYKFMTFWTQQSEYVVAYKFENEALKIHLLEARQPGCVPHFLISDAIILVQKEIWKNENPFAYVIIFEIYSCDNNMEIDNKKLL